MNDSYITVADFAARQGITKQAAYQSISKGRLKQFVKVIDNKKYIDIQAFEAAAGQVDSQSTVKPVEQVVDKEYVAIIAAKDEHIKALEKQLQENEKQIEFLQQQIERQAVIIEKQLHLQAHTQQLLEEPPDEPPPEVRAAAAAPQPTPGKKNLFQRIFKK